MIFGEMPSCENCVLKFFEFLDLIGKREMLLEWLKDHGAILREKNCVNCGRRCCVNPALTFACQKVTVSTANRKEIKTQCNWSESALKNTFFSQSTLSLETICRFVLLWSVLRPPRKAYIMNELSIGSRTAVHWSSFCRKVCIHWCHKMNQKFGGVGIIVEIDQVRMRKRKANRGKKIKEKWVFGGFERESKKLFVCGVQDVTKETLLAIIKDFILPGTTIISDCSEAYDCLKNEGFEHLRVNRSINFVDPTSGAHIQNIKRCWREVWESVPKYGGKDLYLEGYLSEFLWKRSLPNHPDRLHSFFKLAGSIYNPIDNTIYNPNDDTINNPYDDTMQIEVMKFECHADTIHNPNYETMQMEGIKIECDADTINNPNDDTMKMEGIKIEYDADTINNPNDDTMKMEAIKFEYDSESNPD